VVCAGCNIVDGWTHIYRPTLSGTTNDNDVLFLVEIWECKREGAKFSAAECF